MASVRIEAVFSVDGSPELVNEQSDRRNGRRNGIAGTDIEWAVF